MKLPFFNESLNEFSGGCGREKLFCGRKEAGRDPVCGHESRGAAGKELEVELFDRGCRPVMLTEEAMLLLKDVLACRHTLEIQPNSCSLGRKSKPVYRIGVIEGSSKSLMPQLIKALQSEASEIAAQIGTSLVLVEKLVRNELDFAFTSAAYDEARLVPGQSSSKKNRLF